MKDALLCDTLTLINLRGCHKRKVMEEDKRRVKQRLFQGHQQPQEAKYSRQEQMGSLHSALLDQEHYEDSHLGGYRRIYPGPDTDKQQLEEIRLKQEQEASSTKRRKDPKEQNQGESAGEKSRSRPKLQKLPTHLAYRNWNQGKELLPGCLDSMQPQKIVEEEELERIKGLLHREALIRSLGIIDQVAHMLHPSHQGQKKLSECWPRCHQDGLGSQQLQSVSLFPLVLLRGAAKQQGPPHFLRPVRPHESIPRISGPLPSVKAALLHHSRCHLQPRNFNWRRDPAAFGPCSLSVKKPGSCCFPSAKVRLTGQGQASRRLEAINRALAGWVPPSLTPKEGYFLRPQRVVSGPRTECTLPSVVNSEHTAAKAWGLPLCPNSVPLVQSTTALLDISHHR